MANPGLRIGIGRLSLQVGIVIAKVYCTCTVCTLALVHTLPSLPAKLAKSKARYIRYLLIVSRTAHRHSSNSLETTQLPFLGTSLFSSSSATLRMYNYAAHKGQGCMCINQERKERERRAKQSKKERKISSGDRGLQSGGSPSNRRASADRGWEAKKLGLFLVRSPVCLMLILLLF